MPEQLSKPAPFDGSFMNGGIGVIARRQQDPMLSGICDAANRAGAAGWGLSVDGASMPPAQGFLTSALSHMAGTAPLRLLRMLLAQDGTAQMARTIQTSLAFGASKTRFVAVKDWRKGKGTVDEDGTAEIERVLRLYQGQQDIDQLSLPSTIPSALPIMMHSAQRIDDTGQVCFEAVGKVGIGLTDIVDFEPLSCRYRDAEVSIQGGGKRSLRIFEQQQKDAKGNERRGTVDGWQPLMGPSIASIAWYGSTSNPYGEPKKGASLSYLLRKVARRRDFADWLHNVAWPKVIVEQLVRPLFEMIAQYPELLEGSGPNGTDLTATQWVIDQIEATQGKLDAQTAKDIWMIGEGKAYTINPSSIQGLTDLLLMERLEEIQALDMLPALVGVTDGGTQAYAEVQWLALTSSLAILAAYCSAPAVHLGNYHFRLLGEDLIVRAEYDKLPPIDPQKTAEARKIIMGIQEHLAAIGVNSAEDFANQMSDSGSASPEVLAAYMASLLARLSSASPGISS